MADAVQAAAQNDAQRTTRAFISFLATATGNDQSFADTDGRAVNYPRQYTVIGQQGQVGLEGSSGGMPSAGVAFSWPVLLLAVGAFAAYQMLKD